MLKNFITAMVALLAALVLAEAVLWIFPVPDPYEQYKSANNKIRYIRMQYPTKLNVKFYSEENLPGFENYEWPITFSTNNAGMRGDYLESPKPADEYRIFAVGGSTTECLFLDDKDAWPSLLQELLLESVPGRKANVYNTGKAGAASVDHIELTALRLVHLQPDMIVLFLGFNDQTRLLIDDNRLDFDTPTKIQTDIPFWQFIATEFQMPRRIYYAIQRHDAEHVIYERTRAYDVAKSAQAKPLWDKPMPSLDLDYYANNLKTLISICKEHGIELLLVTHPDTWTTSDGRLVASHGYYAKGQYRYPKDQLHRQLQSINEITRQIAVANDIPCFDAAAALPPDSSAFYDDCHLNPNGSKLMANLLAKYILQNHLLDKPLSTHLNLSQPLSTR